MHASAYADAERFVAEYLGQRTQLRIADIGGFDVNGSLRPLLDRPGWEYCVFDAVAGPNVDRILSTPYHWPEIADGEFDVVVSTQTLEHVSHPWRWMPEVARITAPGGLIYICSPNTWGFHEYPVDCWRVWPDGLRALFEEADIEPLELRATGPDTTGVGRKLTAAQIAMRLDPPGITVLCLTTGRSTLSATLDSLRRQIWKPNDRVWLVFDGVATPDTRAFWQAAELPGQLVELPNGPHQDWGHTPRNQILQRIESGYVVHLDDDDVLVPGALDTIRQAIATNPGALFLFRIAYMDGRRVWDQKSIARGNVGTALFVHPAEIRRGAFGSAHDGDFEFVRDTIQQNPDRHLVWHPAATHLIRPRETWTNPAFCDVTTHALPVGREDCQSGWQTFFGNWFRSGTLLDVGAGQALSKPRLAAGGCQVVTHDVTAGLPVDLVCELADIPDAAYDFVTAFDVLEHVHDDREFVRQLLRIARKAVVLTTPNVWVWNCRNRHHLREYSPSSLLHLLSEQIPIKQLQLFGSPHLDGSHPTCFPVPLFLSTESSVLGAVVMKR